MKNIVLLLIAFVFTGVITSCNKLASETPVPTPTPKPVDSLRIGLLAYYPLNNSGADSSGKGNDVSYYVNITSVANRFGKPNSAFYFDGATSYMVVSDNNTLRLNNTDFTVSAWVKPAEFSVSAGSIIFAKRGAGLNNGWGFSINGSQSTTGIAGGVFLGSGGGNINAVSTKGLVLNNWSMVTGVYNAATKQITLYINGVVDNVTSNVSSPNALITADLYIGRDNPSNGTSYFYKGVFDDMRIYNKALTAKEVQKLFVAVN